LVRSLAQPKRVALDGELEAARPAFALERRVGPEAGDLPLGPVSVLVGVVYEAVKAEAGRLIRLGAMMTVLDERFGGDAGGWGSWSCVASGVLARRGSGFSTEEPGVVL